MGLEKYEPHTEASDRKLHSLKKSAKLIVKSRLQAEINLGKNSIVIYRTRTRGSARFQIHGKVYKISFKNRNGFIKKMQKNVPQLKKYTHQLIQLYEKIDLFVNPYEKKQLTSTLYKQRTQLHLLKQQIDQSNQIPKGTKFVAISNQRAEMIIRSTKSHDRCKIEINRYSNSSLQVILTLMSDDGQNKPIKRMVTFNSLPDLKVKLAQLFDENFSKKRELTGKEIHYLYARWNLV